MVRAAGLFAVDAAVVTVFEVDASADTSAVVCGAVVCAGWLGAPSLPSSWKTLLLTAPANLAIEAVASPTPE